jgi:predicted transcriptional regulator
MAKSSPLAELGRRERQIMEVVYRLGRASVAEVREHLPDPPSYSAVRAMLRVLEDKGHLRHEEEGPRYMYLPTVPRERASESALKHLVRTFFHGSAQAAMAALLDLSEDELSETDYDELSRLVERSRKEGR